MLLLERSGGVPIIEDDVSIGANAVLLGNIKIHKGAKIGAGAVVLCDVPESATAVGVPARIIMTILLILSQSYCPFLILRIIFRLA